jgi:predicted Zn-dependent peptidase
LSELSSCNTSDYRTEYFRFQQIFPDSMLSKRFPIGKEALVLKIKKFLVDFFKLKKMTHVELRKFYDRHYRVDNMTLHICGTVDVPQTIEVIKEMFTREDIPKPPPIPCVHIPLNQCPPRELLSIFQNEANHQFSFVLTTLYPIEPLRTLRELRMELILGVVGKEFSKKRL